MAIKVVYNGCFGGFSLSEKATERLSELGVESATEAIKDYKTNNSVLGFYYGPPQDELPRHDLRLIQVVEELGEEANGRYAYLQVDYLKGSKYIIEEYDGNETVREPEDVNWIAVEN